MYIFEEIFFINNFTNGKLKKKQRKFVKYFSVPHYEFIFYGKRRLAFTFPGQYRDNICPLPIGRSRRRELWAISPLVGASKGPLVTLHLGLKGQLESP